MFLGVQNYTFVIAVVALGWSSCDRKELLTFVLIATTMYIVNSSWIVLFMLKVLVPLDSPAEAAARSADENPDNDDNDNGGNEPKEKDGADNNNVNTQSNASVADLADVPMTEIVADADTAE